MAEDVVIRAEGLGKKYIIGHETKRERYTALRDVAAKSVRNVVNRVADVARGRALVRGAATEEFWALKDVSFKIKRGEVLGIIGRNGAGKSTLLKILSRITEPTEGRVTIEGHVASLLEVGTGFHPELTGRENIYLNGAILGMSRAEIKRKFDEIVDFSGVEKFIDTPVKRYSSGMQVRLGFSVAAHLEPEILIVDEVLAVGDAEFQRKCLGKMSEVAGGGRTVIFVSHNSGAVRALCERAILVKDGRIQNDGKVADVLQVYADIGAGHRLTGGDLGNLARKGEGKVRFRRIAFFDQNGVPINKPATGNTLNIALQFDGSHTERRPSRVGIAFYNAMDALLFHCACEASLSTPLQVGAGDSVNCRIPRLPLTVGQYKIGLFLERDGILEDWLQEFVTINVADGNYFGPGPNVHPSWEGKTVLVDNEWHRLPNELTD